MAEFANTVDSVKCTVEIQPENFSNKTLSCLKNERCDLASASTSGILLRRNKGWTEMVSTSPLEWSAWLTKAAFASGEIVDDQVKKKLNLKYNYLGEQKIKNIKEPVRAYWVLSLPGSSAHRFIKAKMVVNKTWRNVIVAATVVLIIGAASAIGNFYSLPKFPVEKIPDQSGDVEFVASDKRKALEAIKRREKELKMEMEEQRIAAEQKRIEEEKRALEANKRQEETLKIELEKQKIAAERKRFEEEKRALKAKRRQEERLKIEMEKRKIAAERKQIEEEKKALEAKIKQEETRKKQLAYIPKAASKSRDDGIVYHKPHGDNRFSLAVFPFVKVQ